MASSIFAIVANAQAPQRTILAVGAHAGDAELTIGPVLAAERARGTRVVILDLTLGEKGHPTLSAEQYGAQKRREATSVAAALGAELEIGPYRDAELPDNEDTRRWMASAIRRIRPTLVITHWKESIHRYRAQWKATVLGRGALDAGLAAEATSGASLRTA